MGVRDISNLFSQHFNGRLAFSVGLVAVSAANYGFDNQSFGLAQAMVPFEKQFGVLNSKGEYELQAYWLSLYSSVIWVGFAVGLVVGSSISARYGRRVGMLALSLWAMVAASVIGMELAVLPVYQAEAVPTPVRGLVVSTYQVSLSAGGLIMNLICLGTSKIPNNNSWRIPFGLFYIAPAIVISGLYWVPESPRWLLVNSRQEEALRNLRVLRQGKRTEEEIVSELKMIETALREEPEQGRFKEIWQTESIRRTLIACGINFFQQISGQQVTAKFGALIVQDIGNIDPFIITVTFELIGLITVIVVMVLSDRLGRRPFLLAGMFTMCIAMFGFGACGVYSYTTIPTVADLAIFFLVLFSFGFSLGYAPLTNVVMTEVVSLRLRDMTQRTAGIFRAVANFIVGFTLPYEISTIGLKLGFIYGGTCFVALLFTYLCIPECKGKSLELIERMFHEGIPSRRFGSYEGDLQISTDRESEEIARTKDGGLEQVREAAD